ncbi:MAG: TolC family protein [Alphaproteobacteria bacterium]|nr:TolC family protein [Alphaproteobacteria bacterium]MBR4806729.1 TolC family protein [Alphaproteobacteria bacterium]
MRKIFLIAALVPMVAFGADDCATRNTVPEDVLSLQDVIKLGLCRNPQTAAAYASLRSSHFNKNAGYASYLPSVSAGVSAGKNYKDKHWDDWSYGASISASYLIFDFGKRTADMNQMIATYRAAGFDFSETVQNFVYGLVGTYYELLNADANVESAKTALAVAQTAYDTASNKFKAGVVARADVLKAETTLASSKLSLERAKNNREITKGTLLTKLSFPADQNIAIEDMGSEFGTDAENENIDELIKIAREKRPDLLKASANKDAAWHRRNSAFLKNLPSISASGSIGWNDDSIGDVFVPTSSKINGSIGIRASMPIFAGFANMYGLRAAESDYDRAKFNEQQTINTAMMDVYTAYQNYRTAQTVLKQTEALLKSATESEKVTSGMYKVGRATMLDWQTAQSELVDAQRQHNSAKYDLFVKRAAVALAIGDIKSELEGDK